MTKLVKIKAKKVNKAMNLGMPVFHNSGKWYFLISYLTRSFWGQL